MILHLVVAAAMAVATTRAWPISPLGDYLRGEIENQNVTCGDDVKFWVHKDSIKLNFLGSTSHLGIPPSCSVKIRIDVDDLSLEKYGLRFTGVFDFKDQLNVNEECSSSSLTITDMDDEQDETGTKTVTCGHGEVTYHTSQDSTNVQFVTGPQGATGLGFSLLVEPHYLCGGRVTTSTTISSPDYPKPYPIDIGCFWFIQGEEITLRFLDFDLYPKKCNDLLEIQTLQGERDVYCASKMMGKVMKYNGPIYMKFRSSKRRANVNKGFNCKVSIKSSKKSLPNMLSKFYEE
ncbi:cubilin-like [Penaeus chinensis]|uniref:cubilin-like n=1 Tax=Penaeus chinensis TaxID=139456 RepID=UPI001FB7B4F5|nr:cubilin-like [Penaeus chinensis]